MFPVPPRKLTASWERQVLDELAEEGWMLAGDACEQMGITYAELQGCIRRGELESERRRVLTNRLRVVVRQPLIPTPP